MRTYEYALLAANSLASATVSVADGDKVHYRVA